jgi:hypothetical protein
MREHLCLNRWQVSPGQRLGSYEQMPNRCAAGQDESGPSRLTRLQRPARRSRDGGEVLAPGGHEVGAGVTSDGIGPRPAWSRVVTSGGSPEAAERGLRPGAWPPILRPRSDAGCVGEGAIKS